MKRLSFQFPTALVTELAARRICLQTTFTDRLRAQSRTVAFGFFVDIILRRRKVLGWDRLEVAGAAIGVQQRIEHGGNGRDTYEHNNQDFHGPAKLTRARYFDNEPNQLGAAPCLCNAAAGLVRRVPGQNLGRMTKT